jgi:hypothetical protein
MGPAPPPLEIRNDPELIVAFKLPIVTFPVGITAAMVDETENSASAPIALGTPPDQFNGSVQPKVPEPVQVDIASPFSKTVFL